MRFLMLLTMAGCLSADCVVNGVDLVPNCPPTFGAFGPPTGGYPPVDTSLPPARTPEPMTAVTLLGGLLVLFGWGKRKADGSL